MAITTNNDERKANVGDSWCAIFSRKRRRHARIIQKRTDWVRPELLMETTALRTVARNKGRSRRTSAGKADSIVGFQAKKGNRGGWKGGGGADGMRGEVGGEQPSGHARNRSRASASVDGTTPARDPLGRQALATRSGERNAPAAGWRAWYARASKAPSPLQMATNSRRVIRFGRGAGIRLQGSAVSAVLDRLHG